MAQIFHVHLSKLALFKFCLQLVFMESVKHLVEVNFVLIFIIAIDQNIVKVHQK